VFRPTQDATTTLAAPDDPTAAGGKPPPWWLAWLTPWRCRLIFAALLALGFYSNWQYLHHNCPLDLAGDEAHYWDWSRQLDLSYYSKGPAVAYIIRFGCWLLGDTMPGVRLPAMLLAIGTATITYWLVVRLFKSDRMALGLTVISGCVPAFMAGGLLMTIDPPFFFMWGLATCFAALAVLEDRKWAWVGLGMALGLGNLAKFAMLLWLVGFVLFLILDKPSRRYLKSPWLYVAVAIGLAFMTPIVVWNAHHGWVTTKHVEADTATNFKPGSPFEMLGSQAGILGLSLATIMVGAVAYVFRKEAKADPNWRAVRFLACIGLTYFGIVFLQSLRSRVQPNWPAPAYFTLLILCAYFLSVRFRQPGRWRAWWIGNAVATVATGIVLTPVAHDPSLLYRFLPKINSVVTKFRNKPMGPREIDPTCRLRGWAELGQYVGDQLKTLSPGAFVMTEDYQRSSEMAFYVPGQPKTYCCASYVTPPRRSSQFDMWPDRSLDPAENPSLVGKDCVFVGFMDKWKGVREAFGQEPVRLPDLVVKARGWPVAGYQVWLCRDFKGMKRAKVEEGNY
jgi:undecaprenyl-diphosphatase